MALEQFQLPAVLKADDEVGEHVTRQRLKRGVFRSVADLEQAIARYIREHNGDPKPFVWTKPAKAILDKLSRLPEPSV